MVEDAPMLKFDDAKRGISKRILVEDGQVTGCKINWRNFSCGLAQANHATRPIYR